MKLDIRALKARSADLTEQNRGAVRTLVLWYCGALAVLTLGSNGLNLFLDSRIGATGGLSGIGMRSMLQTIQTILNYINQFFGPFWTAGFLAAMITMVRGGEPRPRDLAAGFRRAFRIFFSVLFEGLTVVVLLVAVINLSSILFTLSPLGADFNENVAPILADPNVLTDQGLLNESLITYGELFRAILPMMVITAVIYVPLVILVAYSFRMALYLIMTSPIGAVAAHFLSMRLMRGHKWQIFRLDLSWWWYYLLGAVSFLVGYLDLILEMLGLPLPMDGTVMFFVTLAVYCVLFTLLSLWKKAQVDASYVLAYESIVPAQPEEKAE